MEGDATETLAQLTGPFDFIFLDGTKTEYMRYLEMAEQNAAERAVLVVDNMLMSGDVGLEDDSEAFWSAENLASARDFNRELVSSERVAGRGAADRRRRRVRGTPLAVTPATAETIVSTACS